MSANFKELEERMDAQARRMDRLTDEFGSLKLLLEKNNTSLEEFIDLAKGFKFGLKVLGCVESIAVWITKVALALGSLWAAWKFVIKETLIHLTK